MIIDESKFATKEELIDFLVTNKKSITMQKKAALKYADAISFASPVITKDGSEIKAEPKTSIDLLKQDSIKVRVVINTTNLMDSHIDVHMKGTFKQSVKQNKSFLHLQEHESKFGAIISDDAKASLKTYDWADLGYDFKGQTEALVFDSEVRADRNKFMFEQYAKGFVKNHSVGMQYINLEFAANDERYPAEKAVWDKWISEIANKDEAERVGYFWAVTEAKVIEGSAVVRGSNYATPTLSIKTENETEPLESTQIEDTESRKQDTFDPIELKNFINEQIKLL
jgi:hypothetical protein